jgi:hypothetical protein
MNFSVNQVRHLYVANAIKDAVVNSDAAGTIAVKSDNNKNFLYFAYKGADTLLRSDLIDIKNILSVTASDADSMKRTLKAVKVTLDSSVGEGNPIVGQDYILRVAFKQFVGMSDEDQYFKYGMVHAYKGLTASDFYKKLAISLAINFSRELTPLLKFSLATADGTEDVDAYTKEDSLTGTYTGVILTEVEQEWTLGIKEQVPVYFDVYPTTVEDEGDEVIWGVTEEVDSEEEITNGHIIADLEYFCMGDRGDQYRNIGWPNTVPTKYLVDPTAKYNVIDIHYAYTGANENVQKSEKTLTIVVPKTGTTNAAGNKLANELITKIASATGLTITALKTA